MEQIHAYIRLHKEPVQRLVFLAAAVLHMLVRQATDQRELEELVTKAEMQGLIVQLQTTKQVVVAAAPEVPAEMLLQPQEVQEELE